MIGSAAKQLIRISITRVERMLLLANVSAPSLYEAIRDATTDGRRVTLLLTLRQVERLRNLVEAQAEQAERPGARRKFKRVLERLRLMRAVHKFNEGTESERGATGQQSNAVLRGMLQADKSGPDAFDDALHALIQHHNATPTPEAGGLSPHQLNTLIYCGWWAKPFPITLNSNLPRPQIDGAVFFHNARTFLGKIANADGLEATAQGNLSRQTVAQLIEIMPMPADYMASLRTVSRVINERDVLPLHTIRIVCELAGLVRRSTLR